MTSLLLKTTLTVISDTRGNTSHHSSKLQSNHLAQKTELFTFRLFQKHSPLDYAWGGASLQKAISTLCAVPSNLWISTAVRYRNILQAVICKADALITGLNFLKKHTNPVAMR